MSASRFLTGLQLRCQILPGSVVVCRMQVLTGSWAAAVPIRQLTCQLVCPEEFQDREGVEKTAAAALCNPTSEVVLVTFDLTC